MREVGLWVGMGEEGRGEERRGRTCDGADGDDFAAVHGEGFGHVGGEGH